ncbi:TetR/AcrR family transcriptional regulator [Pediococcus claussenii]|uniref:Transcriptional regulator, TetR family n=1 Tax=Pediococcus claussenii (strain ATCC BAA-344 / DSM 14800 / JCM 18046 / KCTC 3811 / LMG 21948 / P06) TaxID=701521 RepID=G8PAT6_PEDCP|nr:TetR/AcrR family transcriptional regulator [Pediococcus claussenii]AEV94645.1 Transcriptional regulator, TetR family [Pediococcus claussenii ATCC BAA-344]ANZ69848.1 TetR family transcriptional regulator [Pediococcus claussenii]ANZ71665.1 TetR family transcriptional regulator [Pediococcus claussenii]KRN20825.1 hypothetical protein IV79_GL000045 [Pediococcus claussenii]
MEKKTTRRRGKELEHDILEAAWKEFQDKGYGKTSMEGIAKRAKTTKTVLYRRWPKKAIIFLMAFRKFGPQIRQSDADTGNLRDDLIELLEPTIQFLEIVGKEAAQGLVVDQLGSHVFDLFKQISSEENETVERIMKVLTRADKRGEVNISKISKRAVRLPVMLVVDALLTDGFITKKDLLEIVDNVLVPTYKYSLNK